MGKVVSSIFGGGDAGASEMRQSNQLMRDNIARIERLNVPTIEEQKLLLENPELIGLLEAEQLGPSRFEEIAMDPRLQEAQRSVLEDVSGVAKTGFGATDRLALEEIRRRAAGQAQAQIASQEQRLQEQGIMDSGLGIILRGQAGQQAAEAERMSGMQQAAQAQQARMSALGQQGSMAAQMQGQNLQLAGQKATRADEVNLENKRAREAINLFNTQQKQNIANMGTATRNQQQMYNQGLIQQKFQNEMAKATGVTGQQSTIASNLQQQAAAAQQAQQAQTGALFTLAGAGIGGAFGGVAGAQLGANVGSAAGGLATKKA